MTTDPPNTAQEMAETPPQDAPPTVDKVTRKEQRPQHPKR
jgi:hypothetical protein